MKAKERFIRLLEGQKNWEELLLLNSGLPGPRANLELAFAVAESGSEEQFLEWAARGPDEASGNSPEGFVALCGVMGLGYLAARGNRAHLPRLKELANDPRWRIREAVALGLQKYGDTSLVELLTLMEEWSRGTLLERRAVVAALCEPALLKNAGTNSRVIDLLDGITAAMLEQEDRRSEPFRVLRKSLGYGWSVAIVASPVDGRRVFEKWAASGDPDVRWIVRENLKKKRLQKMDPGWVESMRKSTMEE